ncbi:hypothetical protein [Streptomyces sp. BH055]|uniref:hypothetical protein n=1 Tax=unclassified Streptomyces TaxID=2593676 RepID=UPI003BB571E0
MPVFKFPLNEVVDVARHCVFAPSTSWRVTAEQVEARAPRTPALWWVSDHTGLYLTGNTTRTGAPGDVYAEGYGPGEHSAARVFGHDSQVIDAIPLGDVDGGLRLPDLHRAHRAGHNMLVFTFHGSRLDMTTREEAVPIPPRGLTVHTRAVVDLATARGFRLVWQAGKASHVLTLGARGPHGPSGHIVVGARTGKVLRGVVTLPSVDGPVQRAGQGTNAVRGLLEGLERNGCLPGCEAPNVAVCHALVPVAA